MSGVVRVTKAAIAIGQGNFSFRVPLGNEGKEIQNMVKAFNDMVVKIELLMKELKDVTNNIAHDLRSPLTRIRGIVETTVSENQNNNEYKEMAGIVIEECDRLIVMINTMLEIAEMERQEKIARWRTDGYTEEEIRLKSMDKKEYLDSNKQSLHEKLDEFNS